MKALLSTILVQHIFDNILNKLRIFYSNFTDDILGSVPACICGFVIGCVCVCVVVCVGSWSANF